MELQKSKDEVAWRFIRESVFVNEQGFQNEFDDIDAIAQHIVLYSDEEPIGCGRVYPDKNDPTLWHLGRLAILKPYRKCGYGSVIIAALEAKAQDFGATMIQLSAQEHAIPFYERCGYEVCGTSYLDEHVPHRDMKKAL